MSEVILPVPYRSQWDPDATATRDDCGPASVGMILDFLGEKHTTDEIFGKTGAPAKQLISIAQISTAISSYGFVSQYYTNQTEAQLRSWLDKGMPVIALVHYGDLSSRQDKGFLGGHFFVVTGYRDDCYFVNDPNFWGNFRADGDHHSYLREEFVKAWTNATVEFNPTCSYIVITPKQPMKPSVEVFTDQFEDMRNKCDTLEEAHKILGLDFVHFSRDIFLTKVKNDKQYRDDLEEQNRLKDVTIRDAGIKITDLEKKITDLEKSHNDIKENHQDATMDIAKEGSEITTVKEEVKQVRDSIKVSQMNGWQKIVSGFLDIFLRR